MLVKTFASSVHGIEAHTVCVEVNINKGLNFFLVGLPDSAIKESQQRIESALSTSHFKWPLQKIVINMAPADLRKEGAGYDLPLAIGILTASGQIKAPYLDQYVMMGELSLDGALKRIKGVLSIAIKAKKEGFKGLIVPKENAREAAVIEGLSVYGACDIVEVVNHLSGKHSIQATEIDLDREFNHLVLKNELDFRDVKGQENVKRALEVAAAGSHNLIMIGPPGSGKSMLAKRISGILPSLSIEEALETTKIHSVAGILKSRTSLLTSRPFRAPHHTISDVALVGGGSFPQPGEISLANHGVLFLDELPEFKRSVLEVLRQPIEDRRICISRSKFSIDYPAAFMLVAAMNPCPCGYYNHPWKECVCGPGMVQKYLNKISGPLLDRIDIHIEVVPVPFDKLTDLPEAECSNDVRERVHYARKIQSQRFKMESNVHCNAQMNSRLLRKYAELDKTCSDMLKQAMEKIGLSARAYDRIRKVSRTIADLSGSPAIKSEHLSEAIHYRNLDREVWGG